jgi:hypothetical protein
MAISKAIRLSRRIDSRYAQAGGAVLPIDGKTVEGARVTNCSNGGIKGLLCCLREEDI